MLHSGTHRYTYKRLREIKHYEKKIGVAFSGYETEQGDIKEPTI